jgi:hypothetical protein
MTRVGDRVWYWIGDEKRLCMALVVGVLGRGKLLLHVHVPAGTPLVQERIGIYSKEPASGCWVEDYPVTPDARDGDSRG